MAKNSKQFETYVNSAIVLVAFIEIVYSLSAQFGPDSHLIINPFTIIILVSTGITLWLVVKKFYSPIAVVIGAALLSIYLIMQPPRVEIVVFYNELDDNKSFTTANTYIIENTIKKEPIQIIDSNGEVYRLTVNNDGKASVILHNTGPAKVTVCEASAFYDIDRHTTIIICSLNKNDLKNCVNQDNTELVVDN